MRLRIFPVFFWMAVIGSGIAPASAFAAVEPPSSLNPKFGVGSWIWANETSDSQECHFWRVVTIPNEVRVSSALLRITADNFFTLYVDGQAVGTGADWHTLTEYDLSQLLTPGVHVLAIKVMNNFDAAGLLMGMRITLSDGRTMEIASDPSWRIAAADDSGWMLRTEAPPSWPAAKVVGAFGAAPWTEKNNIRAVFRAPVTQPVVLRFWQTSWFQLALAVACGLVTLACLLLLGRLVIQSQAQRVVQRERSRIARDIHDDLTAWLARMVVLGERTQQELPTDSAARSQVGEMCENGRSLLSSLNQTIWVINSKRDTLKDLVSYVCRYAESFFQPTPIRCRFDVEENLPALPCNMGVRRNVFLAVKEALNNVLRHSAATEVHVRIHRAASELVVCIEDDGHGFDPAGVDTQRNGLSNMRSRAEEAGGSCEVASSHGAGCRVTFRVPLSRLHNETFKSLFARRRIVPDGSGQSPAPPTP
jgi:signal transduction histidine kinase